ncbi:MAG: DUF4358 domain-containing protein [Oscillospiraceae bacterium]|nr:DUF4358 domain-containing protein [Oscillospiraceae bacterium]
MKKFNSILKWTVLMTMLLSLCLAAAGCGSSETETSASASTSAGGESPSAEASETGESGEGISCLELYLAAGEEAQEGLDQIVEKQECTLITQKYWDLLDDFFYATDDEQVYCICIVRATDTEAAETVRDLFDDQLASMENDSYLTTDQQEVVQAARVGSDGQYVWYISLSSSSADNQNAENVIKDLI